MMRGVLACCVLLATGCTAPGPAVKPTFDLANLKPSADGDAPTFTGWLVIDGRDFKLYPTAAKPADNDPCVSGVLLSLAGMPTPDFSNRVMNVTGYVFDKIDPGAEGAANPCHSAMIVEAIEVSVPDA
ncbi:MAG: hypothetical protein ABMA14_13910 [Hyphomonadaceae bacterium]